MSKRMIAQRTLLIVLLAWALVMIVPDLLRVVQPLGSYGFIANNDGLIYDVSGPFDSQTDSPAWKAGIRVGDRLDVSRLKCFHYEATNCGNGLTLLGGPQYVLPGRAARLSFLPASDRPARELTLIAEAQPANPFERFVVLLDQIAGIVVVVAAGWLVWTRPSAMSWGFFLYVMWFNPGQVLAYYALLQQWTPLLLAQNALGGVAEAAGYMGLLLFVLRAPDNTPDPKWRWLERALPAIGIVLALGLLASYGSFFHRTEISTRFAILTGFVVAICAVGILLERRRRQPPENYQRLRWVIWGCLIGLPSFTLAELGSNTAIFDTRWGNLTPSQDILGLLYLVNGVLCMFVFEAVRRARVVSVAIPLRRVTILGLTLSIPALLLHHEIEYMQEHLAIPNWAWIVIGAVALYLISRLHETATRLTDRYFNRELDRVEKAVGLAILRAEQPAEVDRLLAEEPFHALNLTSAASFRRNGAVFKRNGDGNGWDSSTARTLSPDAPIFAGLATGAPFAVGDPDATEPSLPTGLSRPVLAVPAANPLRCFALSLYGPHISGTDLDPNERAMLRRLGEDAAAVYAELENIDLRERIMELEGGLGGAQLRRR
jgi:hypothetical protein